MQMDFSHQISMHHDLVVGAAFLSLGLKQLSSLNRCVRFSHCLRSCVSRSCSEDFVGTDLSSEPVLR